MSRLKLFGLTSSVMAIVGLLAAAGPHLGRQETSQRSTLAQASPAEEARVQQAYGALPLRFEANRGQTDDRVDFLSRGSGYGLFLTPTEAVLSLRSPRTEGGAEAASARTTSVLRMQVVGGNPDAEAAASGTAGGEANFLLGRDPIDWITDVPTYGRVNYRGVYHGIDVSYYGAQGGLEYDFIVAPGSDPATIALRFEGAKALSIDPAGDLMLAIPGGEIRHSKPVAYQEVQGTKHPVPARFVLSGDEVGFEVGAYDPARPLVIDPVLAYSTYLGGSGDERSEGTGGPSIAVDSSGSAYVAGTTVSADFPVTSGALDPTCGSDGNCDAGLEAQPDVFVTKLDPSGTKLVYSTFLGGSGREEGPDIAVDAGGAAYIAGDTTSGDFPTTADAFQPACTTATTSCGDAFVAKLLPDGSGLSYSTHLGANGRETSFRIALGADGTIFGTGQTFTFGPPCFPPDPCPAPPPNEFPVTPGAFARGGEDLTAGTFLARLDPSQDGAAGLVYSTLIPGELTTPADIAVDESQLAYVVGETASEELPITAGAFQEECKIGTSSNTGGPICSDAFIFKVDTSKSGDESGVPSADNAALVYSTYLGGSESASGGTSNFFGLDQAKGVDVDNAGNVYLTGRTDSPDFPTTPGAFQTTFPGCSSFGCDGFVTKLRPAGQGAADLLYSSFLGAPITDQGNGIAVNGAGHAVITGQTLSTGFPTKDPVQAQCGCFTSSTFDAFVATINLAGRGEDDLVFSTFLGGSGEDAGEGVALDAAGNAYVTGITSSPQTGGVFGPDSVPFPVTSPSYQASNAGGFDVFVTKIELGETPPPPPPPRRGLSVDNVRVVEGDRGTRLLRFKVTLGAENPKKVEVRYRTLDGTASESSDYQAQQGKLRFRPGVTTQTVSVEINGDVKVEANETFFLELYRPKRAPIDDARGRGTIVNDD
ncbi:MAG: SBBP repeat-containing protein [Actinomycetota bacterium]|nr:SBBP repeat-containing protein [Actinomycetota bacterium]